MCSQIEYVFSNRICVLKSNMCTQIKYVFSNRICVPKSSRLSTMDLIYTLFEYLIKIWVPKLKITFLFPSRHHFPQINKHPSTSLPTRRLTSFFLYQISCGVFQRTKRLICPRRMIHHFVYPNRELFFLFEYTKRLICTTRTNDSSFCVLKWKKNLIWEQKIAGLHEWVRNKCVSPHMCEPAIFVPFFFLREKIKWPSHLD